MKIKYNYYFNNFLADTTNMVKKVVLLSDSGSESDGAGDNFDQAPTTLSKSAKAKAKHEQSKLPM